MLNRLFRSFEINFKFPMIFRFKSKDSSHDMARKNTKASEDNNLFAGIFR